jgi:hypothetical protein
MLNDTSKHTVYACTHKHGLLQIYGVHERKDATKVYE